MNTIFTYQMSSLNDKYYFVTIGNDITIDIFDIVISAVYMLFSFIVCIN